MNYSRLFFAPLFLFECANLVGILHLSSAPIWLGLVGTSGVVWLAMEMQRGVVPQLPAAIVVGATYLDAAGDMFGGYEHIYDFDKIVHGTSGFAAALFFYYVFPVLWRRRGLRVSAGWAAYIVFLTALSLGVLFEIMEYLADIGIGRQYWLGSGPDTVTDIIMDAFGAAAALILLRTAARDRKGYAGDDDQAEAERPLSQVAP
jgi:hypothetical protein